MESARSDAAPAEEALRKTVDAYRTLLIRYGMRRLEDPEAVEELVADTFLAAWTHWADKPEGDEVLFWLYGIAHNLCRNMLRGQERRLRLYRRLVHEQRTRDGTRDETAGAVESLIARIRALPAEDRDALQLAYWEGLSHREIALVIGSTENAVGLRLSRARRRLREQLGVSNLRARYEWRRRINERPHDHPGIP